MKHFSVCGVTESGDYQTYAIDKLRFFGSIECKTKLHPRGELVARPLRIEYPGAFFHVTTRGNEKKGIFKSRRDREKYLSYLEFVFTPKHGSWLNLIEVFFSKIARSFLRYIRVQSKAELVERIYQEIEEINQEPVVFRW